MKNPGSHLVRFIFFGNYFYGLCAVALAVEAQLQQNYPLNDALFYVVIFCGTVLFYSRAYIVSDQGITPGSISNPRTIWYRDNRNYVMASSLGILLILAAAAWWLCREHGQHLLKLTVAEWFLACIFPVAAALYYGISDKRLGNVSLRNIGWLKPFIISFAWAGLVTVYPVLYYNITNEVTYELTLRGFFLFLKNFMFIAILCILFDIKDYATDHNAQLKTVALKLGLRKLIYLLVLPLCFIGLGSFLAYALSQDFSDEKIAINVLPFLMIMVVAWSMHRRRPILYYLIVIDGLMLAKAFCGTIAMAFF